jgi:D-alanyl-D-alanine carboxypeptidase
MEILCKIKPLEPDRRSKLMRISSRILRKSRTFFMGLLTVLFFFSLQAPGIVNGAQVKKSSVVKKQVVQPKKAKHSVKKKLRPQPRGIQAKAAYCVNLRSNETLHSTNADQQLPVASLSKLVTAMVALDHFPMDRKLEVPENIKKVPKSVVGLKPGDELTVKDLLHGLLIGSGNDCAETLACAFPGGKKNFVAAMNKKARSLGMRKTLFYTPSGLDQISVNGSEEPDVDSNVSTAREIASIARAAFSNPTIREVSLKKSHILASEKEKNGYPVRTTNKLLRDNLPLMGGKTGYTSRAGHCLATEFTPGHNTFLIVVLGSPNHFRDTRLLYHKALKETSGGKAPVNSKTARVASQD